MISIWVYSHLLTIFLPPLLASIVGLRYFGYESYDPHEVVTVSDFSFSLFSRLDRWLHIIKYPCVISLWYQSYMLLQCEISKYLFSYNYIECFQYIFGFVNVGLWWDELTKWCFKASSKRRTWLSQWVCSQYNAFSIVGANRQSTYFLLIGKCMDNMNKAVV